MLVALLLAAHLSDTGLALGADRGDHARTIVVNELGEVSATPDKAICQWVHRQLHRSSI